MGMGCGANKPPSFFESVSTMLHQFSLHHHQLRVCYCCQVSVTSLNKICYEKSVFFNSTQSCWNCSLVYTSSSCVDTILKCSSKSFLIKQCFLLTKYDQNIQDKEPMTTFLHSCQETVNIDSDKLFEALLVF